VLRRYLPKDAEGLLVVVDANRDLLRREFAQMASLESIAQSRAFIEEKSNQWNAAKTFCFGIWHKSSAELIGQLQVKNVAWEIPAAELGYFIGGGYQRKGYASESIQEILRVAFGQLSFERIFVRILPSNRETFALARKLGFREEGVLRKAFRCGYGELHDVRGLAIVREERLPAAKTR